MSRRPAPASAIEGFEERARALNQGAHRLFGRAPAATSEPAVAPAEQREVDGAAAAAAVEPAPRRRKPRVAKPAPRAATTTTGERKLEALFLVPRSSLLLLRHEADRRFEAGDPRREQRFSAIVGGLIDRAREAGFAVEAPVDADEEGPEEGSGERLPLRLSEPQHAWVHSQYSSLYELGARGRALTRSSVIRALLERYLAG